MDVLEIENTVDREIAREVLITGLRGERSYHACAHAKSTIIHRSIDDLASSGTLFYPMRMLPISGHLKIVTNVSLKHSPHGFPTKHPGAVFNISIILPRTKYTQMLHFSSGFPRRLRAHIDWQHRSVRVIVSRGGVLMKVMR